MTQERYSAVNNDDNSTIFVAPSIAAVRGISYILDWCKMSAPFPPTAEQPAPPPSSGHESKQGCSANLWPSAVAVLLVVATVFATLYFSNKNSSTAAPCTGNVVMVVNTTSADTNTSEPVPSAATPIMPTVVPATSTDASSATIWSESFNYTERASLVTDFINGIKMSTGGRLAIPTQNASLLDSTTPIEARALAWLVNIDVLQLWPDSDTHRMQLQQRYALLTLLLQYDAFTTRALSSATNNSGDNECDWPFVNCTTSNSTDEQSGMPIVTEINTDDGAQTASRSTLSLDLGLLSHLEYLDVRDNGLTGSLPSALGTTWTNMKRFDLWGNALTGTLPSMLGSTWTQLEFFAVSKNGLTGSIPQDLARPWPRLQYAYFASNSLVGSMPSAFCNITVLGADCEEVACDDCCTRCCTSICYDIVL